IRLASGGSLAGAGGVLSISGTPYDDTIALSDSPGSPGSFTASVNGYAQSFPDFWSFVTLAGAGHDTIFGRSLADVIYSGAGNDYVDGYLGGDTIYGDAGNDTYAFDTDLALNSDTIDESGGGVDTLDFSTTTTRAVTINLGTAAAQDVNAGLTLRLLGG